MRMRRISVLVVGGILATAWAAAGQAVPATEVAQSQPKKPPEKAPGGSKPDSLEEAFEAALQRNAEIKAAESKVREAEASLNQVRQQILGRVVVLHRMIAAEEKTVAQVAALRDAARTAYEKGASSFQDIKSADLQFAKYESELTRLRAELDGLTGRWNSSYRPKLHLGVEVQGPRTDGVTLWDLDSAGRAYLYDLQRIESTARRASHPTDVEKPMADRIRAFLNKTVKLDESPGEIMLKELLDHVRDRAGLDVPFRLLLSSKETYTLTIPRGELPVGAWLQAFEDSLPDVRFLVRDYGILVTTRSRTPDGAVRVNEFWKQRESQNPASTGPQTPGTR